MSLVRVFDPVQTMSSQSLAVVPLAAYDATTSFVVDVRGYKEKSILVKNTGANSLTWNIIASVDDGANYDYALKADNAIAAGSSEFFNSSIYVTHWTVQVLAAAATTCDIKICAVGD